MYNKIIYESGYLTATKTYDFQLALHSDWSKYMTHKGGRCV